VLAHKTLLAGVGVFEVGREKAANKFDQLFVDGSAFVNDLLEKGESIETQIYVKLETKKMLKDKISALRAKLGFGNESRDQQVDNLSQRVDSLIEVVAKLAQQKTAEKKVTAAASTTKKEPVVESKTSVKAPAKTPTKPAVKAVTKNIAEKPAVTKAAVAKPAVAEPVEAKAPVTKSAVAEPVEAKAPVTKSAVAEPVEAKAPVTKSAVVKPAVAKPVVAKPPVTKPAVTKPVAEPTSKLKADEKD
jgi:polyhydroxyalkanoate synthesis regulator phasin